METGSTDTTGSGEPEKTILMDPQLIPIQNKRNKLVSHMSREQWDKIQADPQWNGVFVSLEVAEPAEVKALREKQNSKKVTE